MASRRDIALRKLAESGVLPTNLSAAELMGIRASVRERAFFSARVENARLLDDMKSVIQGVLERGEPAQNAVGRLAFLVEQSGYVADPEDIGTIKDLSSAHRLRLIAMMNAQMARGYAKHRKAQTDAYLRRWPVWHFTRIYERKEPRDWPPRWREAGGRMLEGGMMVAPVNSAVWQKLSVFGLPYPPFDYNSGMGWRAMTAARARKLGVRVTQNQMRPKPVKAFNEGMQAELPNDPAIRRALMDDLGDGYVVRGGAVVRR